MTAARAAALIDELGLSPHPEGGYYAQTFRSRSLVEPADGRGARPALTTIYFLLPAAVRSRWHRVRSDEVWHFYEGAPLELLHLTADLATMSSRKVGSLAHGAAPHDVIPAGDWQAARSLGAYTLVGCTVGPGFDFADFTMLADEPDLADRVRRQFPGAALFI